MKIKTVMMVIMAMLFMMLKHVKTLVIFRMVLSVSTVKTIIVITIRLFNYVKKNL